MCKSDRLGCNGTVLVGKNIAVWARIGPCRIFLTCESHVSVDLLKKTSCMGYKRDKLNGVTKRDRGKKPVEGDNKKETS